jgi:hypothetical protein
MMVVVNARADLAYSEAVRGLDEQRSALDTIQARAGLLLAFAAVMNVGLGQLAFAGRRGLPLPLLAIVGIAAATLAAGVLLAMCWPRPYGFTLPPSAIILREQPFNMPDEHLVHAVVQAMDTKRRVQEDRVSRLNLAMKCAIGSVAINAGAWSIVALWTRR